MDLEAELARFEAEMAGLAHMPEQPQEQAEARPAASHAPSPLVPPPQGQARMQGQVNIYACKALAYFADPGVSL
jgi:hypothetical protein